MTQIYICVINHGHTDSLKGRFLTSTSAMDQCFYERVNYFVEHVPIKSFIQFHCSTGGSNMSNNNNKPTKVVKKKNAS